MLLLWITILLVLWVPIILIEETILLDYIGTEGSCITAIVLSILSIIIYIKKYKKLNKKEMNCHLHNVINALIFTFLNSLLGYIFCYLILIGIFHQCPGTGWDCFLFGIEYVVIGFFYAIISVLLLAIWLIIRLIKYFINNKKKTKKGRKN